jgi:hypothetical protein
VSNTTKHLGEAERVELEIARGALALDSLEKGNAAEDLSERGPEEDLGHAAALDKGVMSIDRGNLQSAGSSTLGLFHG